jgi:hypothetical protein
MHNTVFTRPLTTRLPGCIDRIAQVDKGCNVPPDVPPDDLLAALAPPTNVGAILREQCRHLDPRWPSSGHYPIEVLEEIFKTGARWTESPTEEIAWIRRDLLRAKDHDFVEMAKLLTHDEYCSATVLHELARTPSFRKRLVQVGLLPTSRALDGQRSESYRMAGYRNVLMKFGISVPESKERAAGGRRSVGRSDGKG